MKRLLWLLLLFCFHSLHAQTGAKIGYYYKGTKQSFPVNNARVVIQLAAGETPASRVSQLSAILKVPDTAIHATANPKMVSARFSAGFSTTKINGLLTNLRKQAFINFVHPCFTSVYGKDMGYGNELVVKLKTTTTAVAFNNFLKQSSCSIVKKYPFANNIYVLSAGAANGFDAMAVANKFYESGLFVFAEPDLTLFDGLFTNPNDPLFDYQWSHTNTGSAIQYNGVAGTDMKIQQAWNISTGAGIIVAVIDEGVDTGHADLKANLLQGFDCLSGTANPGDGRPLGPARAHGTNCTGIIAAVANNNIGIAGVAPNCKIIPINLSAADGSFTSNSNVAAGFDYAWQHGADVISNSWGGGSPSSIIDDAINRAVTLGRSGKGSVVLFASGNNNSALSYPAMLENVISVGGVNMCGMRKSPASVVCDGEGWGASYGTGLDVVAPCVKIMSTDLSGSAGYNTSAGAAGDYFNRFNGTSSATPATAGVTALILAANNSLTVDQLRNVLEGTCDKLPSYSYSMTSGQPNGTWNNETGYGLINAFHAVQVAQSGIFCHVQIQANGATRFCPGGSVNLSVTNPVAGTSYQWRKDGIDFNTGTSMTAFIGGSYNVVATAANGCIATSSAIVVNVLANMPALSANAGIDTFICAGQPVKLGGNPVASGGAPWLSDKRGFGMDWQGNTFVKFSLTNPLQLDTIAKNMVSDADFDAGNFFAGGDFTPYGYYAITQGTNKFFKIDTATGAQQLIGTANAPAGYDWSGMSWDASTKNLYGIASASSGSTLCIIDPFTAAVTLVAVVPVVSTEWIAVSNGGNMYVMSDNNYVYKVNKTTGAATALSNPVGADVIYPQDADFDPVTDKLYLTTIIQYQNFVGDLRTLDTTTGISSVIGTLGGLSEIDATGIAGPGYQYNWSPAAGLNNTSVSVPVATPLTSTTYTLNVTDMCGNIASSQVTVHVSTKPLAVIATATDSICVGETTKLNTESNSAYAYQWYLNGATIAGAIDSFYIAGSGGSYTVHIVNGSCDSLSKPFIIKTCELRLNDNAPVSLCATYFYDSGGATDNYSDAESFTKTITAATPGSLPLLTFNSFKTDSIPDVLTIYDGTDIGAPVLATLSGSPTMPLSYTGTSGSLTIRFTSNSSINNSGWAGTIVCYKPAVYRSRASGNADNINTWEIKSGSGFVNATIIPHLYDDSIIIQSGHTVTINTATQLDQIFVKSGAILNISAPFTLNDGAGTDLQVDGLLMITATGNINGNGTLLLNGDLDNSASVNNNVFINTNVSGTTVQTITASGGFTSLNITNPAVAFNLVTDIAVDSLFINNGISGAVTVSTAKTTSLLSINRKINLQNGQLVMNNNAVLNIAETAKVQGGSVNSFVAGPVRCNTSVSGISNLFFPIGKEVYRPVILNVTHSSAGLSVYQAEMFTTVPANRSLPATVNAVEIKRYFTISNISSQPVTNAAVTLNYDVDDQVTDKAALRIAKDDGANNWIDIGGTATSNVSGTITSTTNFTVFGDFILANATGGANTFAMKWLQVDAKLVGKQVQLTWIIGNEINISNYVVERSTDGINFTSIMIVNATATIAAEKQYGAVDRLPVKGTNYYRIKQTSKDGSFSYSKIVQVSVNDAVDFIVWPNPAVTTINVQNRMTIQHLRCYNGNGQLMYDVSPAANQVAIPVQRWAAGIYNIKITSGDNTVQTRFVKL